MNSKSSIRPSRTEPLRMYFCSPTDWQRVQQTAFTMGFPQNLKYR